jgi:hypothetical protein
MRRVFLITIWLIVFSLVLSLPLGALAQDAVTWNDNTTINLPSGIDVVVVNGSSATSFVVNNDSTLTITVAVGYTLTLRSDNRYNLSASGGTTSVSCAGDKSELIITGDANAVTVTIPDATCATLGGGGGGGGSTTSVRIPSDLSLTIDSDAAKTQDREVTLTIGATEADLMIVSNKSDFSDVSVWEDYATSKSWTLTEGAGTKTVYVKFRSASGHESSSVSDTIELIEVGEPTLEEMSGGSGGSASSSNDKLTANFPAGAFSGEGQVDITPTTDYTEPTGPSGVAGSMVYDISVTVGEDEISTFDQTVTLTFTYTSGDIIGLDEGTLAVFYWDEDTEQWVSLGGTVNASTNTITVETTHFTQFAVIGEITYSSGSLVKKASSPAVYYLGADDKLHTFVSSADYFTWYDDFSGVVTLSDTDFSTYSLGENVFPKPGAKLVQVVDGETPWNIFSPNVYATSGNGTYRKITSAAVAEGLYGADWETEIIPVVNSVFSQYTEGDDITTASDYNKVTEETAATNINTIKGL